MGCHAGYVYDVRTQPGHGYWDFHCVQGAPNGDAVTWHEMGYEIGQGWGWIAFRARRPLYGWFLGLLYTFIPDAAEYDVALTANVVLTALAVAGVYAAIARLFGATVGLFTAGCLAFDRHAFVCSSVTLSESLGLALLTWHFWLLVKGTQRLRLMPLA